MASHGLRAFRTVSEQRHLVVEALDIDERMRLFEMLACVMDRWPHNFLESFTDANIKSDRFRKKWDVPWWLEKHVSTILNGSFYRPSPDEAQAAKSYLLTRQQSVSRNSLRRTLGLSYIANHQYVRNR